MKVRLHDFYSGAIIKTIICSLEDGKGYTNKRFQFEPNTEYEFHDPTVIKYFKGEIGDVSEHAVRTPEMVAQLEAYGVPYESKKCSTCPTAKPQVWFNPFVIEEDENDDPVQE